MATKVEVLRVHLQRYLKASRKEKRKILNHLEAVLGIPRKSVIRSLKREQMRDCLKPKKKPGPRVLYTPDAVAALRQVWEAGNESCAELLHPMVQEYVDILIRDGMWRHGTSAAAKLRQMSLGTMKRLVGEFFKIRRGRKGMSATKPSALKKLIPIFTGPWEDKPPGYGQIDTVVHCGSSLLGDMAYTLNYTDAATYLVIPRAQWNKGMEATSRRCGRGVTSASGGRRASCPARSCCRRCRPARPHRASSAEVIILIFSLRRRAGKNVGMMKCYAKYDTAGSGWSG